MIIENIQIDSLSPAEYNPRKDLKPEDPEYKKIKRSIEEFGYVDPVIINDDLTIIGGHQRWKVLKDLGYEIIECVTVHLSKEKEKALNLALNKISGEWDEQALAALLKELKEEELDMAITGFDDSEISKLLDSLVDDTILDDNFEPPEDIDTVQTDIKLGDRIELGPHRLLCGDATNPEHFRQLMENSTADMVFTDPPYNVDYTGKTKDSLKIQNDHMSSDAFREFLTLAFSNARDASKAGASIYVCHADSEGYNFRGALNDAGWKIKQCIIWAKDHFVLGRQDYQWQHEPILYGWNQGAHAWYGDRKQSTIWHIDRPTINREHPTMKPVGLVGNAIRNSSKAGDIIFDAFLGSGNTLIAADRLGRKCYGMEIDPRYCQVICDRYKAEKREKQT